MAKKVTKPPAITIAKQVADALTVANAAQTTATQAQQTVAQALQAQTAAMQTHQSAIQKAVADAATATAQATNAQTAATAAATSTAAAQAAAVQSATQARNSRWAGIGAAVVVVLIGLIVMFFVDHGARKSATEAAASATNAGTAQTAVQNAVTQAATQATNAQTAATQAQNAATAAQAAATAARTPPAPAAATPAGTPVTPAVLATSAVPVDALVNGLTSDNPATVDQASLHLAGRPDAIPALATLFAKGDNTAKKRVWAVLKVMGEPARERLLLIVTNPMLWAPEITGAAREILIKGFHQNLDTPATPPPTSASTSTSTDTISRDARALADVLVQIQAIERALNIAQGEATAAARTFHWTNASEPGRIAGERMATVRELKKMLTKLRAVADVLETSLRISQLPST